MKEIILIGSYQLTKPLNRFITSVQQEFKIVVRYVCLFSIALIIIIIIIIPGRYS